MTCETLFGRVALSVDIGTWSLITHTTETTSRLVSSGFECRHRNAVSDHTNNRNDILFIMIILNNAAAPLLFFGTVPRRLLPRRSTAFVAGLRARYKNWLSVGSGNSTPPHRARSSSFFSSRHATLFTECLPFTRVLSFLSAVQRGA